MKFTRIAGVTLAVAALLSTAHALEPRTWIVLDGRIIEGTLESVSGNAVSILDKDGHKLQLDKSFLSIGDNEYIKENFPDSAKKSGFSTLTQVALPQPAKSAKIDTSKFQMNAGDFSLPTDTFDILETPHFKVMYQKPINPKDVGELAERMWMDAAYVHETFPQKFVNGQKMAIFLAPDDSVYDRIGQWYANLLSESGNKEEAAKMSSTWPQSAAAGMNLTTDIMNKYNVVATSQVFRAYKKGSSPGAKNEQIRGVWTPFFVHCLAGDMLEMQAPGTSKFGGHGFFALTSGHCYFKEVSLTGKSETGLLRSVSETGKDVSTARGLEDARQWAGELKKWVRKGEVKPTFETLNLLTREGTDPKGLVLAYAWSKYLQNSIPKMLAYNKLIERIGTSRQVPEPDDFAKFYGFNSGAEMEADFQKWLSSPEFR